MNDRKIGKLLKGVDMNNYWYCLTLGERNRNVKMKGSVDQVKLHKKYKKEKEKKDKSKENNNG